MSNMKSIFKITILIPILLMVLLVACPLNAKEWPSQPITIIVGWSAGGSTDLVARGVADSMSKTLGVPVLVENKTGAAGHLALSQITKAKPDGYTLGLASHTYMTEKPFYVNNLPFDPLYGFTWIAACFKYGNGWVVRADSPWKTLPEFINAAKKQPGKLTCGVTGTSSVPMVAWAKIQYKRPELKGIITLIPFKGGLPAVTALLGGHIDSSFQTAEWKPQVDAGKLRLLLVLDKTPGYPSVPTFEELGYGDMASASGGILGPPGLPEEIREKLERAVKKATEDPEYDKKCLIPFAMTNYYKPGKEYYKEVVVALYEENKIIIPKLGLSD